MGPEQTFYSDDLGVRITPTRAIFGLKTYSMANITSVARRKKSAKRTPGIIIAILGVIILAACTSFESTAGVTVGVVVLGLGIFIATIVKPTYYVEIMSASGEAEGTSSKDKQYIDAIVMALNEALIRRG